MAGYIPTIDSKYYLQQAQTFFGRPVTKTEYDNALPIARLGNIFTKWIKGKAYLEIPSLTHVWQYVHYFHRWYIITNNHIPPLLQRLSNLAVLNGTGLNFIRAWTFLGPLLTMEETNPDGSIKIGSQKSLDKKLLEASYWGASVIVIARFAKDSGVIGVGWEKLLQKSDVLCVTGIGLVRAFQVYNQPKSDPQYYMYDWMENLTAILGVAAAVLALIALVQSSTDIRWISQALLNKINLSVTVGWALSSTVGYFYNKYYMSPDVTPDSK